MVLCKFYLQGNCRFGENCKFEHSNVGNQHQSLLHQGNFNTNANVGNTNINIDTNTLIRAVVNDTSSAEKGSQWLLSCYAPFKEKPNFPGFEEESMEEVRWGFYEAQQMGTIPQFTQQLQMSLQAAVLKLRSLQNPSHETINTIKAIYNATPGSMLTTFSNNSPFNPLGNIFNSNNSSNPNSVFGNSNTNAFVPSNTFGNAVFGQPQQNSAASIFATANQKLFGESQSNSIFGNNPVGNTFNTSPPFGQSYPTQPVQPANFNQQQTNIFGAPPQIFPQQSANIPFGGMANSPFNMQNTQLTQQNNSPMLATQQPVTEIPNQFVQPQINNNVFNTPAFNPQPTANTNIFGGALQTTQPFNIASGASIFASSGNTRIQNVIDERVYSKLEDLSESDIKSYQSEHFEFGKIPERPPTIEMCL